MLIKQAGSSILNSNCALVDCFVGDNWTVGDPICVEHASCRKQGGWYYCECDTGYVEDGLVAFVGKFNFIKGFLGQKLHLKFICPR